jgi:F-type H+-transporting ATPase subunit epsilon
MPESKKLDDMVDSVVLPGVEGDFEVLPEHTPVITKLRSGIIRVHKSSHVDFFALHDGFVTVENDNVLILSENCEHKDEVNLQRAEKAKERAEKRVACASMEELDYRRAEAALRRALTRIHVSQLHE